ESGPAYVKRLRVFMTQGQQRRKILPRLRKREPEGFLVSIWLAVWLRRPVFPVIGAKIFLAESYHATEMDLRILHVTARCFQAAHTEDRAYIIHFLLPH